MFVAISDVTPGNVLGDAFCVRRKVGQWEVGGFTWREKVARPCLGLVGYEKPLVRARRALTLNVNGPRKQSSHLIWPLIPVFKTDFSAR